MIDRRDTLEYWVTKNNWEEKMNDRKTVRKHLISTIQFIHELTEEKVSIIGLPFAEKEGKFVFDGMTLSFLLFPKDKVQIGCHLIPSRYDSLLVITKNGSYQIPKAHVSSSGEIGNKVDVRCHVRFDELSGLEWNKKKTYYYRFLIPIEKDDWLPLIKRSLFYRDCPGYDFAPNQSLITIDFGKKLIHAFTTGIKGYQYLVIESRFPCTYNEMLNYTYAVSLSLGLVTTIAPFDYAFVVASEMPEFNDKIMGGMIKLRPTIRVQYKLQFSAPIEEKDFAKLVLMLHRNKNLARAAMMLLVASDDIEYLGPLYSVALETICLELFKENKDIIEGCLIEKPWGKDFKNNDEKLTKPFELLKSIKYDLSEVEKLIIKTRNSFLHGDIPKGGGSADELENMDELDIVDELLYISSELRRLCMILLFRYVGIKEPKLAIFYNEKVKQTVDEKLIRKKQKEEEEEKKKKRKSKSRQKQHAKSRQEQQAKSRQKQHANQSKNSTRKNQGKEKSPQPTEEPEASV